MNELLASPDFWVASEPRGYALANLISDRFRPSSVELGVCYADRQQSVVGNSFPYGRRDTRRMGSTEVIESNNSIQAQQMTHIRNVVFHHVVQVASVNVGKPDRSVRNVLAYR